MFKKNKSILIIVAILAFFVLLFFVFSKEDDSNQEKLNLNVDGLLKESVVTSSNDDLSYENYDRTEENDNAKIKNRIFEESFFENKTIEETGRMDESLSSDWWVNSGAYLFQEEGIGRTIFGELEKGSKWQIKFKNGKRDIPEETDGGYHPQNIFRLVTKTKWKDFNQEVYYRINEYILSKDKHRRESNGLFLFNRYQDGDNLYYTGVRVDGAVVVKKKYKGEYYQMGYKKIFWGDYDRDKSPNLLPIDKWIGLKSEVKDTSKGVVDIKIFMDIDQKGDWELLLEVEDDGKSFGGDAILQEGYAGIRTDFMDVEFDNYKIEETKE